MILRIIQNYVGFCGQMGCHIAIIVSSGTGVKANNGPESKDCPYFYKFSLGSAGKSSKYSPCTNRPVACTLCNESAIWSYNMKYHYETVHKNSTLPSEFIIPDSEIKNVKKKF